MASASNPTALAKLLESVSVSEPSAAEHIGMAERDLLDIFGLGIEVFGDVMYLHTRGIFVESVSFSWHHSVKGSLRKGSNIDE